MSELNNEKTTNEEGMLPASENVLSDEERREKESEERRLRIRKKKRKRVLTVLLLIAAVCILGGGVYLIRKIINDRNNKKVDEDYNKAKEQVHLITDFWLGDVDAIEYTNADGSYRFEWIYTNEEQRIGAWKNAADAEFPVHQTNVQQLIDVFCNLVGMTEMSSKEVDLATFGLDNPKITATVFLKDGRTPKFQIGIDAPFEEGCYLLDEATGNIYIVDATARARLSAPLRNFIQEEVFPTAKVDHITSVEVAIRGEDLQVFEAGKDENGAKIYPKIFVDCGSFPADTVIEYACKDFSKYGLDNPMAIVRVNYLIDTRDDEGKAISVPRSMMLEIGNTTEADNYYVRVNESQYVYIMQKVFVDRYLDTNASG